MIQALSLHTIISLKWYSTNNNFGEEKKINWYSTVCVEGLYLVPFAIILGLNGIIRKLKKKIGLTFMNESDG